MANVAAGYPQNLISCRSSWGIHILIYVLIFYLWFHTAFNTIQIISRRVVGRAEETSTYSWSRFYTVNCQPTVSNYQLSHLRYSREPNPSLRGGRRECYTLPPWAPEKTYPENLVKIHTWVEAMEHPQTLGPENL